MNKMKRDWGAPRTEIQRFAPQEFVAVCLEKNPACTNGCVYGWTFNKSQTQGTPSEKYETTIDDDNDSWVMLAPEGFAANNTLHELFDGTSALYTGWTLIDSDRNNKISAGDYIQWSGANFYVNKSNKTSYGFADPSVTIYSSSNHS